MIHGCAGIIKSRGFIYKYCEKKNREKNNYNDVGCVVEHDTSHTLFLEKSASESRAYRTGIIVIFPSA